MNRPVGGSPNNILSVARTFNGLGPTFAPTSQAAHDCGDAAVATTPFIRYGYLDGATLRDSQRIKAAIHHALEPIKRSVLAHSLGAIAKKRGRRV